MATQIGGLSYGCAMCRPTQTSGLNYDKHLPRQLLINNFIRSEIWIFFVQNHIEEL